MDHRVSGEGSKEWLKIKLEKIVGPDHVELWDLC